MKIAVLGPEHVPPIRGGLDVVLEGLAEHLGPSGHEAFLIRRPTREHSLPDLVRAYRSWAELDLSQFDAVISLKYPTWMAAHPRHVVWMAHKLRGLFDLYPAQLPLRPRALSGGVRRTLERLDRAAASGCGPAEAAGLACEVTGAAEAEQAELTAFPGPLARELVRRLDEVALRPRRIARYAALSRAVRRRPEYFPDGVPVEVIFPPLPEAPRDGRGAGGGGGGGGDYFLAVSRLDRPKRLDLVIRAFRQSSTPLGLVIAGTGPELPHLLAEAAGDRRIEVRGFVPDAELRRLYAGCRAVAFAPLDEDFGYVGLEAFRAGKPLITTLDAGGPAELVEHERTGLVVRPVEAQLAWAFDELSGQPGVAEQMGRAAREVAGGIRWDRAIGQLLGVGDAAAATPRPRPRRRRKLAVALPFPVSPARGGGQVRVKELYGRLARHADVELVCFQPGGRSEVNHLGRGLRETVIGASPEHRRREAEISWALGGLPVTDVAMPLLLHLTPEFGRAVAAASAGSDLRIACHPYAATVLQREAPYLPLAYEAQDVEAVLKPSILGDRPGAAPLLALTERLEAWCVHEARVTIACSREDGDALTRRYRADRRRIALVPNGVDVDATRFLGPEERTGPAGRRPTCLFLGSYHPPNVDAAELLVRLAPALAEVDLVIAGSVDQHFRGRALPANVRLVGFVSQEEKLRLLHQADLALNPVVSGSGTNLKLLEYLAAGTPALTTPVGLRGLEELRPACLVAEAAELEGAIRAALALAPEDRGDARLGRRLVEEGHSWDAAAEKMWAALRTVS